MPNHSENQVRAVTFDVGGTLIEPWPSVGHIYAEVAARRGGRKIEPEELNRRFVKAWRIHGGYCDTRKAWEKIVDATFDGLIEHESVRTFFPDLYARFTEPAAWHVYEDVLPVLNELKRRDVKLGVISNWDDRLRPLLAALKLESYFEVIVVSCEVSAGKPAPVIFETAAEKLKTPPGRILHVGDSETRDVSGARSAGFQAAHLVRGEKNLQCGQMASLSEIRNWLGESLRNK